MTSTLTGAGTGLRERITRRSELLDELRPERQLRAQVISDQGLDLAQFLAGRHLSGQLALELLIDRSGSIRRGRYCALQRNLVEVCVAAAGHAEGSLMLGAHGFDAGIDGPRIFEYAEPGVDDALALELLCESGGGISIASPALVHAHARLALHQGPRMLALVTDSIPDDLRLAEEQLSRLRADGVELVALLCGPAEQFERISFQHLFGERIATLEPARPAQALIDALS